MTINLFKYDDTESTYQRMQVAIEYIREHFKQQPSLAEVAEVANLSTTHFQKLFTEWVGLSPKKFLQYTSIEYAKGILKEKNLADTAFATGLSGTGRLHDLFVKIEGMTPGEYKRGGEGLIINYHRVDTIFGQVFIASTTKGVCYLAFVDEAMDDPFIRLQKQFPKANFHSATDEFQARVLDVLNLRYEHLSQIKLHLKGTEFQLKVWNALLRIPYSNMAYYSDIASWIHHPKAVRAVGTAIGDNPVAYLIPCHRVIRADGGLGGYHWGLNKKIAMLVLEKDLSLIEQK